MTPPAEHRVFLCEAMGDIDPKYNWNHVYVHQFWVFGEVLVVVIVVVFYFAQRLLNRLGKSKHSKGVGFQGRIPMSSPF